MRNFRSKGGLFQEQPYYKPEEIENMCMSELKKLDLLPDVPQPIRIDRFVEKRFDVSPTYEDLPEGMLGFTRFGSGGVEEVVVAVSLDEEGSTVSNRRIRTTLAHEAGHGLLHSHLFVLGTKSKNLFDVGHDDTPRVLCRDSSAGKNYDGKWWEYQANRAMASLLLPRVLVEKAVLPYLKARGTFGVPALEGSDRSEAIKILSDVFDVNPKVVEIRLNELFPLTDSGNLSL